MARRMSTHSVSTYRISPKLDNPLRNYCDLDTSNFGAVGHLCFDRKLILQFCGTTIPNFNAFSRQFSKGDIYRLVLELGSEKIGRKYALLGQMGSKCKILLSGPPKGTSLRETSFDVLIVKIGVGGLAVQYSVARTPPPPPANKLAESLCTRLRARGRGGVGSNNS